MNLRVVLLTLIPWLTFGATPNPKGDVDIGIGQRALLDLAKLAAAERYQFTVSQGARIRPTPDERSFYVLWYPAGAKPRETPLIVTLHGQGGWAFDEFFLWHEAAATRGLGVLALQWWFGEGEGTRDYYQAQEMFPIIASLLQEQGTVRGNVLLHGFSRGAAHAYALTFLDRRTKSDFFGLTVADAGGVALGDGGLAARGRLPPAFPLYAEITRGKYGTNAFVGTHWILYAGGLGEDPERDGVLGMRRTARWLEGFGGKVDMFLDDPGAGVGGFHQNRRYVDATLSLFERLRTEKKGPAPLPPASGK